MKKVFEFKKKNYLTSCTMHKKYELYDFCCWLVSYKLLIIHFNDFIVTMLINILVTDSRQPSPSVLIRYPNSFADHKCMIINIFAYCNSNPKLCYTEICSI